MKKRFPKGELVSLGLPYDDGVEGVTVLETVITGTSRWSIHKRVTFRLPGQSNDEAWQAKYSVGATESQDEGPWEYQDEVECTLVHLVEKTVKAWEAKPD